MSSNVQPVYDRHPSPLDRDADVVAIRTPPRNLDAEKALLGGILTNNRAYEAVSEFLRPAHFSVREHGMIFTAALTLIEHGQIADAVTLRRYFENEQALADIGGAAYLADLAASAVTVINAKDYGQQIYDLHCRRELIAIGHEVVNDAFDGDVGETSVQKIERAEQALFDLATTGEATGNVKDFKTVLLNSVKMAEAAHRRDGGLAGLSTGLKDLDALLGGLQKSDLLILAGRPSMGKTALATNLAYNVADAYLRSGGEQGAPVGFFSMEMSAEQLATRILSEQSEIASDRIRKGQLTNEEFTRFVQVSTRMNELPLFIDDGGHLSPTQLRTRARRMKRKHGIGLIVIDYVQLMTDPERSRSDGRVQEVSGITRALKGVAKELDIPILALSQLSRAVEQRDPPRPLLADLRESGSIEQDADVVMFIYRQAYYLGRKKPSLRDGENSHDLETRMERWQEQMRDVENEAEILLAKQRHGPIGDVRLFFEGRYTRFGDMAFERTFDRQETGHG